ncbi:MAG: hypothetical protein HOP07_04220 [Bacteriovoracaceae bacterium]|nr:hypothetical protein [Bacteriovoracaceae bacterium]
MDIQKLSEEISLFSSTTHGSSDYDKDEYFIMSEDRKEFAPLKYIQKKLPDCKDVYSLLKIGYVYDSFELSNNENFQIWFEKQFSKKLVRRDAKKISIVYIPNNKLILDQIGLINRSYEVLAFEQILLNGKNLPTQLGEWYAKCIFGLKQVKSTSQRGFDFVMGEEGKRVEIQVEWSDASSPKGVKIKKTLVDLSDYCIIIYVAKNFMIREVCFLDSEYVSRKFSNKGHTIFLKDSDVSTYFFSKSSKHFDKIINPITFLKYASPNLAMKLSEKLSSQG